MIQQVIFRDRQEVQAADLNNVQGFVDAAMQALILDAITGERMFTGLQVTMKSATELEIAPGRLWAGDLGKIFRKAAAEVLSIFSYLPVQDRKYLCLSVLGQEQDADVQPRDFLIDLQSGQTEPRAVAMEKDRVVAVQATAGLESTEPQKPAAPTGYTPIAMVLLSASGIVSIELAENRKLMRLFEVWQGMRANAAWIAAASPKISSLMSDLANLSSRIGSLAVNGLVTKLAADVALLKDAMSLPTVYQSYAADNFLSSAKSDTADAEYYALVAEGVRPPWAGETSQTFDLDNPYETACRNFAGFVIPAHEKVARLATDGYAGDLALAQYQYTTTDVRELTRTRVRTRYSNTRVECSNGVDWTEQSGAQVIEEVFEGSVPEGLTIGSTPGTKSLGVIHSEPGHVWVRYQDYWKDVWEETYWVVDSVEQTINGCQTAQTFLNSQNGWLLSVGLNFAKVGSDGVVHLLLCETANGLPDTGRCIGRTSLDPGHVSVDAETEFVFPQPIFLSSGKRYALVLVTGGDHAVKLVEGTEYSQGTLFHSTDGAYFQGDFTKDLMMTFNYARFVNPRTVVELKPISLSDGMAGFDILAECIVPESTDLIYEYQPSGTGTWIPIEPGTAGHLLGLPAMCRLRAVFIGSQDLMPGLALGGSRIQAARSALTFRHFSTLRELSGPSSDISVILLLEGWDAAKHTCTASLVSGATVYPGTVTDEVVDATSIRRTVNFTPDAPTGITSYRIKIEGTTTTALKTFHVARRMDVAK